MADLDSDPLESATLVPVESLVHEHQAEYYQALQNSTRQTDSMPFIEFMLKMVLDAIASVTHKSPRKSSDYWKL